MKLVCPGCGAQGSIELFTADVDARQFAALMGRVPPQLDKPVVSYLSLFRPPKRLLTWPRARKLLEELVEAIEAGAVRRRGRDWAVTPADFKTGMEQMIAKRDKLDLPLKSHAYLLEILKSGSDKAEAKAEREKEQTLRASPAASRTRRVVVMSELAGEQAARDRAGQARLAGEEITKFLADRGITDE